MRYRPLVDNTGSSRDARQYAMAPWVTYTPAWTSDGSAPSLGNGTLVGAYRREGTTLHVRGQLIVGSGSTVGTGAIRLSFPTGSTTIAAQHQSLAAFWFDASTSTTFPLVALAEPSTGYMTFGGGSGIRAATSGLGSGDYINFTGTIEVIPL